MSYEEAFRYLTDPEDGRYVEGVTESRKRVIRRFTQARISMQHGILWYNEEKEDSKRQWIANFERQQQILQSIHDDTLGGCHLGRDKTREKISKRYFWHGMGEDVDYYIKTCSTCQKVWRLIILNKMT